MKQATRSLSKGKPRPRRTVLCNIQIISFLRPSLLEGTPTLCLWCVSLPCFRLKDTDRFSVRSPIPVLCLQGRLCTCFHRFCLLQTFLLSNQVRVREPLPLASSPQWSSGKVPGFHPVTQVQLLGRELRSLSRTSHRSPSEVTESWRSTDTSRDGGQHNAGG